MLISEALEYIDSDDSVESIAQILNSIVVDCHDLLIQKAKSGVRDGIENLVLNYNDKWKRICTLGESQYLNPDAFSHMLKESFSNDPTIVNYLNQILKSP